MFLAAVLYMAHDGLKQCLQPRKRKTYKQQNEKGLYNHTPARLSLTAGFSKLLIFIQLVAGWGENASFLFPSPEPFEKQ